MAKRKSATAESSASAVCEQWSAVTWPQLVDQFGERTVSKGERYQRSGQARNVGVLATGPLIAFVDGSETYATRVTLVPKHKSPPGVFGECSCPVGSQCKHAVAVVLQALAELQAGRELPVVEDEATDERLQMLSTDSFDEGEPDEEFGDEFDEDVETYRPSRRRRTKQSGGKSVVEVFKFIDDLSAEESRKLLREFVEQQPQIREALERRLLLRSPEKDKLVQRTLKEIRRVTAEPAWDDHWSDEGSSPDYTLLQQLLERLTELEMYDELLEIGRELRQRGLEQIGQSNDDGMLGSALSSCLEVVFAAIPRSSLPGPEQLLYAIDALLDDDYSLCDAAAGILEESRSAADWSVVADQLESRIDRTASKDRSSTKSISHGYRRGAIARFLIAALDAAGRSAEALQWCETEAVENAEYVALCRRLQTLGRFEELRSWIRRGIDATRQTLPGIADGLRKLLIEDWQRTKEWRLAAAAEVVEFCTHPNVPGWKDVLKAAKRAKSESEVRAALLWHFQRGLVPVLIAASSTPEQSPQKTNKSRVQPKAGIPSAESAPVWPLPLLPSEFDGAADRCHSETITGFLIDLAIAERRIEDVIQLYDPQRKTDRKPAGWGWNPIRWDRAVAVADAVAAERPDYALLLRNDLLEQSLQPTGEGAYESVIQHLRAIQPLLKQLGRDREYPVLIERIRTEYRRRRNLIEKLDRLEQPRVVDSMRRSS